MTPVKKAKKVKKKAAKVYKKVEKKAKPFVAVWRMVVALILFLFLAPAFVAARDSMKFYYIMFSITALAIGLIMILERGLKKGRIRTYLWTARMLILIAGLILFIAAFAPVPDGLQFTIVLFSVFFYAMGAQRLGFGIFLGGF